MPDPLDPVGLTEAERLHMTNLREAWRIAAPVYTDLAATDVEWLCTIIDRLSAAPVDDRERLAELEDWLLGAEHHGGCSGEYKKDDGTWAYRCKCGLRELRDERPVSPSVDPEEEP